LDMQGLTTGGRTSTPMKTDTWRGVGTSTADWPVPVSSIGPASAGSVLWRAQGQLHVTAIVKATLAIVPESNMIFVAPEPVAVAERYEGGSAVGRIDAIRENAPKLPLVDVLVFGHAYAPAEAGGRGLATESTARLALVRDGSKIIDKTIEVRGNRARGEEAKPFERIPLSFDCSLGGIGFDANPLGVGVDQAAPQLPNLLDPHEPQGRVACLWPIPPSFSSRRRLRGSLSSGGRSERIVEIPGDLDWSFFQAAPVDQRIELLRGDEWILLKGLSEGSSVLRTRLPDVAAQMLPYRQGRRASEPIPMRADMLQIRPDAMQCTVTWRASMAIADEQAAGDLALVGALQFPGEAVAWPAELSQPSTDAPTTTDASLGDLETTVAMAGDSAAPSSGVSDLEGTYVLTREQAASAAAEPRAPFPLHRPSSPPEAAPEAQPEQPAIPGAPWARQQLSSPDESAGENEAETQARLEAERAEAQRREAAQAEKSRLEAEKAERRRKAEADRFEAEQRAAQAADEARAAEKLQSKAARAEKIKTSVYGGFNKLGD